ncbi:unnamed protein product [Caenorhabditis angaria]|uniref:Uncharacterized protein n=1 Tax=Caenorhabditis angaria TaxID=860376 RepID=A0A9P1N968_9PELO|nr:unnamed protein product [Caenorhabditis angaria]
MNRSFFLHFYFFFVFCVFKIKCDDCPIVITTWGSSGFEQATKKAVEVPGDRTLALVTGLSECEALQCETTVGFGGSPDESGETTLDAMVIDSTNMSIGAVANLHRIKDAAKVAWDVMKHTKHTLLVGESATKFAIQMGYKEEDLSNNETKLWISDWKKANCQPNFWKNVEPNPASSCGPYKPITKLVEGTSENVGYDPTEVNHDTIGMVVRSSTGFSAGTSSNGARFKIPGRIGDSPIPGAGAYATELGGAAATGDGDIMMRYLASFAVVQQIEIGTKPSRATLKVIGRILKDYPNFKGGIVAMDAKGRFGAACANFPKFQFVLGFANGTTIVKSVHCKK